MNVKSNLDRIVIGYCRVSSNKQKDDLERQIENMKLYPNRQSKQPFQTTTKEEALIPSQSWAMFPNVTAVAVKAD